MTPSLLKVLVERKIVAPRTEIDAFYRGRNIAGDNVVQQRGTFLIMDIRPMTDGSLVFDCANVIDGKRRTIASTQITGIDGMAPERLAANYYLDADGNPVPVGKRRGRKPRALIEAEAALAEMDLEDEDEDDDCDA